MRWRGPGPGPGEHGSSGLALRWLLLTGQAAGPAGAVAAAGRGQESGACGRQPLSL